MEAKETIGYKAAYQQENGIAKCRDLEIYPNTTIEVEGTIKICDRGLHYCPKIQDVFKYYHLNGGKVVVFEVLQHGKQHQINEDKCCSNSLVIGNIVSTFEKYDDTFPFSEGKAAVKKDDKWGYVDLNGNEIIE